MRAITHYLVGRFNFLPVIEALILFQAMFFGHQLRFLSDPQAFPMSHGVLFSGVMMLAMTALGLYDGSRQETFPQTVQRILISYMLAMLALSLLFFSFPETHPGRGVFGLASLLAIGGILIARLVSNRAIDRLSLPRKILVLGSDSDLEDLETFIDSKSTRTSARIAGYVPTTYLRSENATEQSTAVTRSELISQQVISRDIKEIVVACQDQRGAALPMPELLELRLRGTRILDLLTFFERELGLIRLEHLRYSWLVFGDGFRQGQLRRVAKRMFDLTTSFVVLLLASPLMVVAAAGIKLTSPGPIFFSQTRVGQQGKEFNVLKFRSMRVDAEAKGGAQFAQKNDPRVTPIGRIIRNTRIDELPQLINVFLGDMSFVGPRPERPEFVRQYQEAIPFYNLRHRVKPGITGWAQTRLPYANSFESNREKLEYDLYYLKNNSIVLDLLIMLETVQVVLRRKGI